MATEIYSVCRSRNVDGVIYHNYYILRHSDAFLKYGIFFASVE